MLPGSAIGESRLEPHSCASRINIAIISHSGLQPRCPVLRKPTSSVAVIIVIFPPGELSVGGSLLRTRQDRHTDFYLRIDFMAVKRWRA